jgi:hypothetical protein
MEFDLAIFEHDRYKPLDLGRTISPLAQKPNVKAHWSVRKVVRIKVVPRDQPTVRMVRDDGLRQRIIDAIQPEFGGNVGDPGLRGFMGSNGMVLVHPVPANLSMNVFARVGEREERIGAIAVAANQRGIDNAQRIDRHPAGLFPDADRFDLVLRPAPGAAERTVDMLEAWVGDEIVIVDVPLRPASTSPNRP